MFEVLDKFVIFVVLELVFGFCYWMVCNVWCLVLLFGGVLLLLVGFVVLVDEVYEFELFYFDVLLLWQMYGLYLLWLDCFFVFILKLGYEWFLIFVDVLIIGVLLGYWCWCEVIFVVVSFVGLVLLNMGSKYFFQCQCFSLWELIVLELMFSFFSGYVMGLMIFVVILVLLVWNICWCWLVLLLVFLFSLLVSVLWVYLGVYYFLDILVGWCVVLVWVVGCYLVMFSCWYFW